MKTRILATAFALAASAALAAPEAYVIDKQHSQIVFNWNHLGYSTTVGMFSGFEGEIAFDPADAAASSVSVSFPINSMMTGNAERDTHFMSPDFFNAEANALVTFVSSGIEVTGENTALITGDLTMNGITKSVVLDAKLNTMGEHPMMKQPWAGFDATTTLLRSDFGVGAFAPFVSDEVEVAISIEAAKQP